MRKLVAAVLLALLSVALTAVAFAASGTSGTTVQQYEQTYSQKRANRSTGTTLATSSTDEQNPRNKQPKRMTNFDITFPQGSRIDSNAAPQCRASENDFAAEQNPDDACPRGSKVGTGAVTMRAPFNGSPDVTGAVYAYNANKGLILLVSAPRANQTLLLRPKFRGRRLLTTMPVTCFPTTRPDNGCRDNTGVPQEVILTNLQLRIRPVSSGRGSRRRTLFTTPRTCPSGGWTFEADITYADGTRLNIPTKSSCRR